MISNPSTFPVINMELTGRNIEQMRKAHGISVRELQRCFGFEYPQAIYNWQHGTCLPSVDNLVVLASLFHVSIEDLLVIDREVFPYSFLAVLPFSVAQYSAITIKPCYDINGEAILFAA